MLSVRNVSKYFGSKKVLDDLNFDVNQGEIYGIIGQNGAGKSTLFRSMMNYFTDYSGEILYNNQSIKNLDLKYISYLPEERSLVDVFSIGQQIKFFAQLNDYDATDEEIEKYLNDFKVKGKITDKIKTLSKGNMQKVQIICALIYKPKLVILDEPFSGLDPYSVKVMQEQLLKFKSDDSIVLFSSHDMTNVEKISDKIMMIKDGKKILSGTTREIKNMYPRNVVDIETEKDLNYMTQFDYVTAVENKDGIWKIYLIDEKYGKELFEEVVKTIGYVPIFAQNQIELSEIFAMEVSR